MEIPWVIGEQTIIKHKLLKSYIEKWTAILYNQQARSKFPEYLLYFDGFSGPGEYWTNDSREAKCDGSPIIVAKIANRYIEAKSSRKFLIIGVDNEQECIDRLSQLLIENNHHKQNWVSSHAEFDEAVNTLLDNIEHRKLYRIPMFIFIDPFGYTGFPLSTLSRLLSYNRVELFINFMIYDIARWCSDPEKEQKLYKQFGSKNFLLANSAPTPEMKQAFLINHYCDVLRQINSNVLAMPFRVNTPGQGTRPRYYLIHVSTHSKALREMKDSMHSQSGAEYSFQAIGINPDQSDLFRDPEEMKLKDSLSGYVMEAGGEDGLQYEVIEEWAYINTPGVSRNIKRLLVELEQVDKILEIERGPRKRKNTVTEGAIVKYIS